MSERQRGLGRGLAALMGDAAVEADAPAPGQSRGGLAAPGREAPIETLKRNPDQPRMHFRDQELDELAASIRERGVLQPILVRPAPDGDGYQIVAGERRWRAAQKAELTAVPIVERALDDAEVLEIGIVENVQRADLNPLEEGLAYARLIAEFGHSQDSVAQVVGKSRPHVANTVRLIDLPKPVQHLLMTRALTAGHARALLVAPNPEALAEEVVRRKLNVRQTEALVKQASRPASAAKPRPGKAPAASDADTAALETDLSEALGVKVAVRDRGGKGELVLGYADLEQLDDLCRRLMRS